MDMAWCGLHAREGHLKGTAGKQAGLHVTVLELFVMPRCRANPFYRHHTTLWGHKFSWPHGNPYPVRARQVCCITRRHRLGVCMSDDGALAATDKLILSLCSLLWACIPPWSGLPH